MNVMRARKRMQTVLSQTRKCGRNSRAGFTVAEVVVASAIMLTVFIAVMGTMSYARRSISLSENRLAALHMARQTMETLSNLDYYDSSLTVGTVSLATNNLSYYKVTEDSDGMTKNIQVVVWWREPLGMTQSVSLVTSMSRSLHQ